MLQIDGQAMFVFCGFTGLYNGHQAQLYQFNDCFIGNVGGLKKFDLIGAIGAVGCAFLGFFLCICPTIGEYYSKLCK